MLEVEIQNFQSITRSTFVIDGFTALVGRSNIGKSALVRAVKSALTGASGTAFVRHGLNCERVGTKSTKCRCKSSVRIKSAQFELLWEKGDGVNRYTMTRDGKTTIYDKVDRGTPEFLRPQFSPIRLGDSEELIQVADQFFPIFLLNLAGPAAADVLSDVAQLEGINEAVKASTRDRKEASTTRGVREKDCLEVERELNAYQGLDGHMESVERVERESARIDAKRSSLSRMTKLLTSTEKSVVAAKRLQGITQIKVPNIDPTTTAFAKLATLSRLTGSLDALAVGIRRIRSVDGLTLPPNRAPEAYASYRRVAGWATQLEALERVVEKGTSLERIALPAQPDFETTYATIQALTRFRTRFEALEKGVQEGAGLERITLPPQPDFETALTTLQTLTRFQTRLESLKKEAQVLEAEVGQVTAEEADVLAELRSFGTCPTCAQPVGGEHELHLDQAS